MKELNLTGTIMKQILDSCRIVDGLEMTGKDIKDPKVSVKSNLKAHQNKEEKVGNISFENIATSPGGAISLLPTLAPPPNDLILVTDRCNIIFLLHHHCPPCHLS